MPFRLALLGAFLVSVPVVGYLLTYRAQRNETRSVAPLRLTLDSLRAELRSVATAVDSTRLATSIQMRERGVSERDYHILHRQTQLDSWWQVPGMWSASVAAGIVLLVLVAGWKARAGRRKTRSPLSLP